jgi:hypothetical protein
MLPGALVLKKHALLTACEVAGLVCTQRAAFRHASSVCAPAPTRTGRGVVLFVSVFACSLEIATQPQGHQKGWLLVSSATSAFVQQPVGSDCDVEFGAFLGAGSYGRCVSWPLCLSTLPHTAMTSRLRCMLVDRYDMCARKELKLTVWWPALLLLLLLLLLPSQGLPCAVGRPGCCCQGHPARPQHPGSS